MRLGSSDRGIGGVRSLYVAEESNEPSQAGLM